MDWYRIDPSYETRNDYVAVVKGLQDALKRFATGTYALWYPMLPKLESRELPDRLKRLGVKDWLHATLEVRAPSSDGFGMHGSGMFIINPPGTLEKTLHETLPALSSLLAQGPGVHTHWKARAADRPFVQPNSVYLAREPNALSTGYLAAFLTSLARAASARSNRPCRQSTADTAGHRHIHRAKPAFLRMLGDGPRFPHRAAIASIPVTHLASRFSETIRLRRE